MAFVRGKDTSFYLTDSGGTQRTVTTYGDSVSVTLESEILDTTTFGSAYKSSTRGFIAFTGSISGKWDNGATATPDQWFTDLITASGTVTSTMTYFPAGSASGAKYYRASVYFANYNVETAVDGIATWSADFELASGSVTIGTA